MNLYKFLDEYIINMTNREKIRGIYFMILGSFIPEMSVIEVFNSFSKINPPHGYKSYYGYHDLLNNGGNGFELSYINHQIILRQLCHKTGNLGYIIKKEIKDVENIMNYIQININVLERIVYDLI